MLQGKTLPSVGRAVARLTRAPQRRAMGQFPGWARLRPRGRGPKAAHALFSPFFIFFSELNIQKIIQGSNIHSK
jgi:hypothetical protein